MSSSPSHSDHSEIKYARGVGARVPSNQRPLKPMEWAVLLHVSLFAIGMTWCFGGGAESLRPYLAWWGSLGFFLTLTALQDREAWREGWLRPVIWLWPFIAFNLLVAISLLTLNLRELKYGTDTMLIRAAVSPWVPSVARLKPALHGLWYFDAIWISCFNLLLVIRQRRTIRGLLMLLAGNALALGIFGTVQKLAGSPGLFFNAVKSPQKYFFSSFIYHNHWGAFTLLMLAASLALIWHYTRRRQQTRDIYHSPVFVGLVAVLLLAITIPLSGSRSSSLLAAVLLGGAFFHWVYRLIQKRRQFKESVAVPFLGALIAIVLGIGSIWYVARDMIQARVATTRSQVGEIRSAGTLGSRVTLYRDTWRLATDRPAFGWGMGSYPDTFHFYNTQYAEDMRAAPYYRDAHSDWLQALAEHGFVGTTLIGLCGVVPLLRLRRRHLASPVPSYLLAGCTLVLLYAWVEFPFGNLAVVLSWWLCFFCAVQYARLYDREAPAPVKTIPVSG
jgi:O-antigen ligase